MKNLRRYGISFCYLNHQKVYFVEDNKTVQCGNVLIFRLFRSDQAPIHSCETFQINKTTESSQRQYNIHCKIK